ncbi:MAG TPA: hypothetical protein VM940_00240 [Chthoniobacterales bacterium]|nr:hypothetical protein [Chthoniobacterales bacterium]
MPALQADEFRQPPVRTMPYYNLSGGNVDAAAKLPVHLDLRTYLKRSNVNPKPLTARYWAT